jgi:hypothetical protein
MSKPQTVQELSFSDYFSGANTPWNLDAIFGPDTEVFSH